LILQNSYWKAWRHLAQFQRDSKFSTWISRIAIDHCLMRLRKARGASLLYLDEGATDDEVRVFELRDRKSTPEAEVSYRQLSTVLRTEIRRLPPLLRGVLEMRDLRELSTERGRRTDRDLDRRRQVAPDARPRGVEAASGTPPRYRPGELSF
jgi:RNA polymerase sigma-70 factor (ECF subfamily)